MDPAVLDTLRLLNPWLDEPAAFPSAAEARLPVDWIERQAPHVLAWPMPRHAHLVVGARQVGKSSLTWHWLLQRGHAPLFLDEAQHLDDADVLVKGLADSGLPSRAGSAPN